MSEPTLDERIEKMRNEYALVSRTYALAIIDEQAERIAQLEAQIERMMSLTLRQIADASKDSGKTMDEVFGDETGVDYE